LKMPVLMLAPLYSVKRGLATFSEINFTIRSSSRGFGPSTRPPTADSGLDVLSA
jgi:hypothetical protein